MPYIKIHPKCLVERDTIEMPAVTREMLLEKCREAPKSTREHALPESGAVSTR